MISGVLFVIFLGGQWIPVNAYPDMDQCKVELRAAKVTPFPTACITFSIPAPKVM